MDRSRSRSLRIIIITGPFFLTAEMSTIHCVESGRSEPNKNGMGENKIKSQKDHRCILKCVYNLPVKTQKRHDLHREANRTDINKVSGTRETANRIAKP